MRIYPSSSFSIHLSQLSLMFDEFFDASTQFCVLWDIELHPDMYISFLWKSFCVFGCVCFSKTSFKKITFQIFMCLFVIKKVDQWKILSGQQKILSS